MSFPGVPGIVIGRNEFITWVVTNVGVDVQDLFVLELIPTNSSEYFFNGSWIPFEIRNEDIVFSSGGMLSFQVKESLYGPVVSDVSNPRTARNISTGLKPNQALALR